MNARWAHRVAAGAVCLAAVSGCGLPLLPSDVSGPGGASGGRIQPEYPLKPTGKRADAKVLLLVTNAAGIATDFLGAEDILADEFHDALTARLEANRETRVKLADAKIVAAWKSQNPDWRSLPPAEVGQKFKADAVIEVRILTTQLFEPGTDDRMLRCRAELTVRVYDLSKKAPNEPAFETAVKKTSPAENPIPVESAAAAAKSARKFLKKVADDLSMKFSAYAPDESVQIGLGD